MITYFNPGLRMLALLSILTGILYPLVVTGLSQLLFPHQANGSLIKSPQGQIQASELIGQSFSDASHFWGRPSATSPYPYNAGASSGSNQGPTNPALLEAIRARVEALRTADPGNQAAIPVDLMTASGSGLDPHISPAAAQYQAPRIARERKLKIEQVRELIEKNTQGRQWGMLGEPTVHLWKLNRDLDELP